MKKNEMISNANEICEYLLSQDKYRIVGRRKSREEQHISIQWKTSKTILIDK